MNSLSASVALSTFYINTPTLFDAQPAPATVFALTER
jgi:hypothetical protein